MIQYLTLALASPLPKCVCVCVCVRAWVRVRERASERACESRHVELTVPVFHKAKDMQENLPIFAILEIIDRICC